MQDNGDNAALCLFLSSVTQASGRGKLDLVGLSPVAYLLHPGTHASGQVTGSFWESGSPGGSTGLQGFDWPPGVRLASRRFQDGVRLASRRFQDGVRLASRRFQDGVRLASRFQDGVRLASRRFQDGVRLASRGKQSLPVIFPGKEMKRMAKLDLNSCVFALVEAYRCIHNKIPN